MRKLRSKASNLTKELHEWSSKVTKWIEVNGKSELLQALRLKSKKDLQMSSVYLFAISRNMARMQGYGFKVCDKNLAVVNWPQFIRTRYELGPVDRVFHDMFHIIRSKMFEEVSVRPLPMSIEISGKTITFEDMWNTVDD